jgi:replication-associated recombination protein RarA
VPYTYATGKSALTCRKHRWGSHPSSEIDEVHRFNRAQQDTLLPSVEEGLLTLIGATTENPYFEVNPPLLSRSTLFRLHPLSLEAVTALLRRALAAEGVQADDDALARAQADVAERPAGEVPVHLRDRHYRGAAALGHGDGYDYPHDDERGWVDQQHRPDEVAGRVYYEPSLHGHEEEVARRMAARERDEAARP